MTFREHMEQAARDYLRDALNQSGGNVACAARIAGTNRTNFYWLMGRYGLSGERRHNPGNAAWRALR